MNKKILSVNLKVIILLFLIASAIIFSMINISKEKSIIAKSGIKNRYTISNYYVDKIAFTENTENIANKKKYSDQAIDWAKKLPVYNDPGTKYLLQGDGNGDYGIDNSLDRKTGLALLYRINGEQPLKDNDDTGFSDVPKDAWYYNSVIWAVQKGITNGTGNGQFSPDMTCSRGTFITFLYRSWGSPELNGVWDKEMHTKIPEFERPFRWAFETAIIPKNMIEKDSDGEFKMDKTITKGEAIEILYKDSKNIHEKMTDSNGNNNDKGGNEQKPVRENGNSGNSQNPAGS